MRAQNDCKDVLRTIQSLNIDKNEKLRACAHAQIFTYFVYFAYKRL